MKIKKIIGIAAIVVLCGIAVFSGVVFHHQYQDQKNSAQQFEDLSNMIADVDKSDLDLVVAGTRLLACAPDLSNLPEATRPLADGRPASRRYISLVPTQLVRVLRDPAATAALALTVLPGGAGGLGASAPAAACWQTAPNVAGCS